MAPDEEVGKQIIGLVATKPGCRQASNQLSHRFLISCNELPPVAGCWLLAAGLVSALPSYWAAACVQLVECGQLVPVEPAAKRVPFSKKLTKRDAQPSQTKGQRVV